MAYNNPDDGQPVEDPEVPYSPDTNPDEAAVVYEPEAGVVPVAIPLVDPNNPVSPNNPPKNALLG